MIFPSTLRRLVIALNGNDGPDYFQAGDGVMKPAHLVMFDDADEVKLCTATGKPIGVVGCDADHDLGTVYASGERIPIWLLGCGVDMYVAMMDPSTITVEQGDIVDSADATTQTGKAKVIDDIVATTDVTVRNVSSLFWIGRAMASGSITAAVVRYVPVRLSL